MHFAFGVFLLGYFCVLLGCFFADAAELPYYELDLPYNLKMDRTVVSTKKKHLMYIRNLFN